MYYNWFKKQKNHGVSVIILLGCLTAIGPLSMDIYVPALPQLLIDLQTHMAVIQGTVTACLLGLAIGQLCIGPLSDLYGRRFPLIWSLVIYVLSSFLCTIISSIWFLILLRFFQGLSGAAGIVISRAIIRDMYTDVEMTKYFSFLMLINGITPILAPVIGGQILTLLSWRGIFLILGVISMCMLSAAYCILPETLPKQKRYVQQKREIILIYSSLLKNRKFIGYTFSQSFTLAAMFVYIVYSPFILQNTYGISPQMFSLIFSINSIGIILTSQLVRVLAGKVKHQTLFIWGLSFANIGALLLLWGIIWLNEVPIILVAFFLVVSSIGIITTTGFSLVMEDVQHAAGTASAILGFIQYMVGVLISFLIGMVNYSILLSMGYVIIFCELGAVLCYVFARNGTKVVYNNKTAMKIE
ncbi:multidrug effflux MFS transporter [Bacillus toyonensis]|uniref:Bcr/CflA family efflux transporter n=1 Tax=Bacillus toyonensis TaxID=155322 RepID=A0A2A8H2M3_9BACI|nr:multidrug effflux MFS transporter [Bacillus toyonensis]PEP86145.1 MFS transporter [Bacillus toyonensis]